MTTSAITTSETTTSDPPTLYAWAGGMPAFERLTALFYGRIP